ncbi:MAG: uroporphyrinogen decarboxylase family protein [Bacillota bacterium]
MKAANELYDERLNRIRKAVALEKPDRTPVVLTLSSLSASLMGVTLADIAKSIENSNKYNVEALKKLGDVDGNNNAFTMAKSFPLMFMTKVKIPGRDLPNNTLWQLDESEVMTHEDYDTILSRGWFKFRDEFLENKLGVDLKALSQEMAYAPQATKNMVEAGYVVYHGFGLTTVNEYLGGGRSMVKFMRDLFKIPDKVEAVLDVILEEELEMVRNKIRTTKPDIVFLSPARGASEFFSPKLWERFVWKYLKQTVDTIVEEGAVCNIHIDSNWERDLDYFTDFKKGTCVFETDGMTDIYKIKEKLGSIMCIKGDVPAGKLVLASPDDVYDYSCRLIRDMGPGFILSSGCTMPPNAKEENVRAMISAATGK